ncbi:HRDC domain-containing protein, partial [Thermodesulfobacteriota bacterium]
SDLATYPRKQAQPIANPARKRIKLLKIWRDKKAGQMGLDPSLLCSKDAIADIAISNPATVGQIKKINALKNWQKDTLGREMVDVLRKKYGRSA